VFVGLHTVLAAGQVAGEGVADGSNTDVLGVPFVQCVHAKIPAGADADPTDVDLVVGASGGLDGGTCQQRRSASLLDEISSRKVGGHSTRFYHRCGILLRMERKNASDFPQE